MHLFIPGKGSRCHRLSDRAAATLHNHNGTYATNAPNDPINSKALSRQWYVPAVPARQVRSDMALIMLVAAL